MREPAPRLLLRVADDGAGDDRGPGVISGRDLLRHFHPHAGSEALTEIRFWLRFGVGHGAAILAKHEMLSTTHETNLKNEIQISQTFALQLLGAVSDFVVSFSCFTRISSSHNCP